MQLHKTIDPWPSQGLQLALRGTALTARTILMLPAGLVRTRWQIDARVAIKEVDRLQVEAHLQHRGTHQLHAGSFAEFQL